MPNRQSYNTPTITRVVLEPTQVVLSPCSTETDNANLTGTTSCAPAPTHGGPTAVIGGANCKASGDSGDSAARS